VFCLLSCIGLGERRRRKFFVVVLLCVCGRGQGGVDGACGTGGGDDVDDE
jgi:hypothetical protein